MKRFEGTAVYSKETLFQLYKAANDLYGTKKIIRKLTLGFVLALAGLFLDLPMILQGILLMSGAWLMVSKDFPARMKAEDVLEKRGGTIQNLETKMFEDHLEVSAGKKMKLYYKDLQHLSEGNGLIFLFFSQDSAVVLENESIKGGSIEQLKEFLEGKSGLEFRTNRSFLSMSLKELLNLIRKA